MNCKIKITKKLGIESMVLKGYRLLLSEPTEVPAHIAGLAVREYGEGIEVVSGTPAAPAPTLTPAERLAAVKSLQTGSAASLDTLRPLSTGAKAGLLATKKDDRAAFVQAVGAGEMDGEIDSLLLAAKLLGDEDLSTALKARRG